MRLYKLTHSAAAARRARRGSWPSRWPAGRKRRGSAVPAASRSPTWRENTERNTVTTAPAAELGVELYRLTGNRQYLQFAEQAYEWVRTCLLEPNGLYADHISRHGRGRTDAVELQPGRR